MNGKNLVIHERKEPSTYFAFLVWTIFWSYQMLIWGNYSLFKKFQLINTKEMRGKKKVCNSLELQWSILLTILELTHFNTFKSLAIRHHVPPGMIMVSTYHHLWGIFAKKNSNWILSCHQINIQYTILSMYYIYTIL